MLSLWNWGWLSTAEMIAATRVRARSAPDSDGEVMRRGSFSVHWRKTTAYRCSLESK